MRTADSPFNEAAVVRPRRDKDFEAWEQKPAPPVDSFWVGDPHVEGFTARCAKRFQVAQKPDKGALPPDLSGH